MWVTCAIAPVNGHLFQCLAACFKGIHQAHLIILIDVDRERVAPEPGQQASLRPE